MGVIEAIGESPISLALVILTVAVAVGRELAKATRKPEALRWARATGKPLLGLVVVFAVIVSARLVMILD